MAHPGPAWRRRFVLWRDARPGYPAPEEADVGAALVEYAPADDPRSWVPAAALYRTYRLWYARHRTQPPPVGETAPDLLTVHEFGLVVRRVFPGIARVRRSVSRGRRVWGYAGLRGPDMVRARAAGWKGRRPATKYRHGWKPLLPTPTPPEPTSGAK